MTNADLACRVEERRKHLFGNPDWNGMDFLEVSPDQLSLCVHFFGEVPENITVRHVVIEGGRRIKDIRATGVKIERAHDEELDDCLRITLNKPGDFSTYRLCLIEDTSSNESTDKKDAKSPREPKSDSAPATGGGQREGAEAAEPKQSGPRPMHGLDPRYSCLEFSFKAGCPSDLDCERDSACEPKVFPEPEINYLAKDYASFRQLILDRLALIMPDWQERHVPDIGITLVELMAYTADYLSYYQDAVATEAYLNTARQRISVRRHARLIDYCMHEGNNARAWVTVSTDTDIRNLKAEDFYFITGFSHIKASSGNLVKEEDLDGALAGWYEVFEPITENTSQKFNFLEARSEIYFYTWGDAECCLPKGATRATLLDKERPGSPGNVGPKNPAIKPGEELESVLDLHPGDVLIFEEIRSPTISNPGSPGNDTADADSLRRHAVRLTKVTPALDGLLNKRVVEIEWAAEDALPFSLCLSARLPSPDCSLVPNVSIARGNVVLVDHGHRVEEGVPSDAEPSREFGDCACEGSVIDSVLKEARRTPPALKQFPVTSSQPLPAGGPASAALTQDPRLALPQIVLRETVQDNPSPEEAKDTPPWYPRYDLLDSSGDDRHFVAEMDDEGRAHLRFGDGELGSVPEAGVSFKAAYRVGNGPGGNVGRDTINYLVLRRNATSGQDMSSAGAIKARNPLPAQGGNAPEPIAEVKLFAPGTFRTRLERAITAEDYAELAQRNAKIQRAAADLCWTGSWYEMRVAIDPAFTEEADEKLLQEISGYLHRYRRVGHDVAVVPAHYVPLRLAMEVCVLPHYARGHVKAELLKILGSDQLEGGKRGFFHPDNLTFGDSVYVSQLVAAAMSVEGVETVRITKLERLDTPAASSSDPLVTGVLPLGPMEIAQLDNDPSFPENGVLTLTLKGGR